MAFSKITTRGMSGDTLEAGDIAANAIGASELADNAVDTAAIADLSVTNAKLPSNIIPVKPHIQYGILQPAVAGKLLDGTTSHSGNYGTAQSDGHSYYYTDIKGSKPIKDPRIGGHFGSQRHKTKSLQLLEQETATEGKNIYSIDGREWMRAYSTGGGIASRNWSTGHLLEWSTDCTGCYIEIVGYFNDINFIVNTDTNKCDDIDVTVNGTLSVDGSTTLGGDAPMASPLQGRYVDGISVINGGSTLSASLGTTPAINTVKYEAKTGSGEYIAIGGIELIAQDTTSTANRSKIQIPSQNVVSYGKKFTVSGTPHYDPFNGFVNDTTLFSSVVDTATSLGLGTATTWGAPWDKGGNDHIRPFNGGRVVKWVDSSGNIKTSVTMMPANAQNIGSNDADGSAGTASNEITTASATNSHTLNFSDDVVDHSLSEVAKTFHWREFGNGAANAGTGGSWADCSMLSDTDDAIAFVMDDGLTSFSHSFADKHGGGFEAWTISTNSNNAYYTFIGTGIALKQINTNTLTWNWDIYIDGILVLDGQDLNGVGWKTLAQNLPYGTHVVRFHMHEGSSAQVAAWSEMSIFQPKKPPIPEDAVVLADYMLMADFVAQTGHGKEKLSKGTRCNWASRDFFYNSGTAFTLEGPHTSIASGLRAYNNNNAKQIDLPTFGHGFVARFLANTDRSSNTTYKVNDDVYDASFNASGTYTAGNRIGTTSPNAWDTSANDGTVSFDHNGNGTDAVEFAGIKNLELGVNKITFDDDTTDYITFDGVEVVTPIHTSHHYQSFETPYLHELVGGDRNMEQTNLIVTADGKSWDEVTRDTSYLGNIVYTGSRDGGNVAGGTAVVWDYTRGDAGASSSDPFGNKEWAIAYDRIICLKDGSFSFYFYVCSHTDNNRQSLYIKKNGTTVINIKTSASSGEKTQGALTFTAHFKRGDYIITNSEGGTMFASSANDSNSPIMQIKRDS